MRVDGGSLGPLASHDAIFLPFPGPEDLQMIENQVDEKWRGTCAKKMH